MTADTVWAAILAAASAVVLLSNACEKVIGAVRAAKAPAQLQDGRISAIEERLDSVEEKLINDDFRLREIKKGDRATQKALLALLDHGIDGNNIKQMQDAKEELNNYLIEK